MIQPSNAKSTATQKLVQQTALRLEKLEIKVDPTVKGLEKLAQKVKSLQTLDMDVKLMMNDFKGLEEQLKPQMEILNNGCS